MSYKIELGATSPLESWPSIMLLNFLYSDSSATAEASWVSFNISMAVCKAFTPTASSRPNSRETYQSIKGVYYPVESPNTEMI